MFDNILFGDMIELCLEYEKYRRNCKPSKYHIACMNGVSYGSSKSICYVDSADTWVEIVKKYHKLMGKNHHKQVPIVKHGLRFFGYLNDVNPKYLIAF